MYHYFVTSYMYMKKQPIFVIYNMHVHACYNKLIHVHVHTSGFETGFFFCLGGERIDHGKHTAPLGGGGLVCSPEKCFKFRPL